MKSVLIELYSNSMGDTIASTPYVSEYQKKHGYKVFFKINGAFIPLLKYEYDILLIKTQTYSLMSQFTWI
jgi:hypothetical protein